MHEGDDLLDYHDHHVPTGMVDGTDIISRARNERLKLQYDDPPPHPKQQQRHWMKTDEEDISASVSPSKTGRLSVNPIP
jgi:hypothetical protein